MGPRRFCPPLIVVWSIVACGDDDPTTLSSSATGTSLSAPISDDPIVATPSAAEPGDLVELTFPTDLDRGANWHLIRWNGVGWSEPHYFVVASSGGYNDDGPDWRSRSEQWSGEDIGFVHAGPDMVIVPESAEPGTWRFCTANAAGGPYCVNVDVSSEE
ncbi:MAG TPA: hypothetical protein VIR58_13480 [Acidimicrobiales bacterium]